MSRFLLAPCILLACLASLPATAQLIEFADGQPAVAAHVNQNFAFLLDAIEDLQAQIDAIEPQSGSTASVVGTWDIVSLDTASMSETSGEGFFIRGGGQRGTVVFNADGTFEQSETGLQNTLTVVNFRDPACATTGSAPSLTVTCKMKSDLTVSVSNASDTGGGNGTWSLSGNTLTLNADGEVLQAFVSVERSVLIMHAADEGGINLTIALKR